MNAPRERSRISAYDRMLLIQVADRLDQLAMLVAPGKGWRQRTVLHGELIDAAARLRTIMIWAA